MSFSKMQFLLFPSSPSLDGTNTMKLDMMESIKIPQPTVTNWKLWKKLYRILYYAQRFLHALTLYGLSIESYLVIKNLHTLKKDNMFVGFTKPI